RRLHLGRDVLGAHRERLAQRAVAAAGLVRPDPLRGLVAEAGGDDLRASIRRHHTTSDSGCGLARSWSTILPTCPGVMSRKYSVPTTAHGAFAHAAMHS